MQGRVFSIPSIVHPDPDDGINHREAENLDPCISHLTARVEDGVRGVRPA